jgi:hypothetical protein
MAKQLALLKAVYHYNVCSRGSDKSPLKVNALLLYQLKLKRSDFELLQNSVKSKYIYSPSLVQHIFSVCHISYSPLVQHVFSVWSVLLFVTLLAQRGGSSTASNHSARCWPVQLYIQQKNMKNDLISWYRRLMMLIHRHTLRDHNHGLLTIQQIL